MRDILDLGSWCILRTASADTLKVLDSMEDRGFNVWTPVQRKLGKPGKDGEASERRFAVTPGYIFASIDDLAEVAALACMPTSDTPRFTLFLSAEGGAPLIGEAALGPLRLHEEKLQRQYDEAVARSKEPPSFDVGHVSPLRGGGFDGLTATVIESRGKFVLVRIPGFNMPIEVSSLLLVEDEISAANPKARLRHRNRRAA